MSDDTQTQVDESQEAEQPTERELLMERADDMGISYSKNIKTETLRERVNAKMNGEDDSEGSEQEAKPAAKKSEHQIRREAQKRAGKLVRLRITCMNQNKRNHEGEYFTAANSTAGTFTKYVPYDTDWHVPQIIFNMIKARKVAVRYDKVVGGIKTKATKLVPEFAVEELPPLSEAEMKQLRLEQARRAGNSDD